MKSLRYLIFSCFSLWAMGCATQKTIDKAKKATATAQKQPENSFAVSNISGKFLLQDSTKATVFLKVMMTTNDSRGLMPDVFTKNFTINYALYNDFGAKDRLSYGTISADASNMSVLGVNQFLIKVDVKRPASNPASPLMLVEVVRIDNGQKSVADLTIRYKSTKLSDWTAIYDQRGLPQLKNFVTVNDTFMVQDLAKSKQPLYVYRYRHEFDAAASPMNTSPRSASRALKTDSSFRVNTNEPISFKQEGLYFMMKDSTDAFGLGVVVGDKRYPRLTQPTDLTHPIMYVSQNQEIAELRNAKDTKKALDRYWLTLTNGNTELAKQTIKAYYKRVEEANQFFTTYKEGWKTDMGMVYIIMGAPDNRRRGRDREVWIYNQRNNFSEINFTFNRRPNQFVDDHYELQRYVEYQPIWYPIVEAWRAGMIRD